MSYFYAQELIKNNFDIVIESIPDKYNNLLLKQLKKHKYAVNEISLVGSLQHCIKNNKKRKTKGYSKKVIKEVYNKLLFKRGKAINVDGKTTADVFKEIKNYL